MDSVQKNSASIANRVFKTRDDLIFINQLNSIETVYK